MIKTITITNYLKESVTITLTELFPEHGMIIEEIEGLGPPKADINMTELATTDGELFNSSRLNGRNIVIHLRLSAAPDIESSRQRCYKYFPIKKPVDFLIDLDHRTARTTGYVESNEPDIFSKEEGMVISLLCDFSYFYSAGPDGTNTTIFYGTESMFEFPFSNESLTENLIEFGSIENEVEKTIIYNGDSETGIVITIHAIGEVGNITIYNTGTREIMIINSEIIKEMTGKGIIAGDEIIISTIRRHKSVQLLRGGYYRNILNAIEKNSAWFQLSKGDNIFAYEAEYGSENLQFKIENQVLYEGV